MSTTYKNLHIPNDKLWTKYGFHLINASPTDEVRKTVREYNLISQYLEQHQEVLKDTSKPKEFDYLEVLKLAEAEILPPAA